MGTRSLEKTQEELRALQERYTESGPKSFIAELILHTRGPPEEVHVSSVLLRTKRLVAPSQSPIDSSVALKPSPKRPSLRVVFVRVSPLRLTATLKELKAIREGEREKERKGALIAFSAYNLRRGMHINIKYSDRTCASDEDEDEDKEGHHNHREMAMMLWHALIDCVPLY